ncbi:MAG: HlyD family secretion protein [Bacteroidota bacterium]|jgi:membrane fusion protein, multidrug efflux system
MDTDSGKERKSGKKILPRIIISTVVIIALIYLTKEVWYAIHHEETDNAQVEMRLVPILSRVSGYVDRIYVDDYVNVSRGQLLMVVDSTELRLQLQEMQADLSQSLSDIENAKASLTNAEASLSAAKSNLEVTRIRQSKAANDLNRDKKLFEGNAITKRQVDDSQSNFDVTNKQLETSQIDVRVAETRLEVLRSLVGKAQAQTDVKKARIDQQKLKLSYCSIYAIADGKLGKRNVDQGQFIQSGTPLFTIVNTESRWVVANFKENQLKNLHQGQVVAIKIDGYPNLDVEGKIVSLSDATGARFSLLPPDNATGNFVKVTQRIPIRIEIIDAQKYKDILRAGMSVVVSAHI